MIFSVCAFSCSIRFGRFLRFNRNPIFVFDKGDGFRYNGTILKRRYESWTFTYVTETKLGEVAWRGTLLDFSLLTPFSNGKVFI